MRRGSLYPHHRSDSFVVANPFIAALSLRQILGLGAKAEAPGRLPGCSWVGSGLFHRTKKPTMRPSAVNQSLGKAQGASASSLRRSANRYSRSQSAASTTGYATSVLGDPDQGISVTVGGHPGFKLEADMFPHPQPDIRSLTLLVG